MTTPSGSEERGNAPAEVRASKVLRARAVWITPLIVTSVVIALISLAYMGSVVNPTAHLRHLSVLVVNEDQGADAGSQHVNLGQQVESSLTGTPAVSSRLSLKKVTLAQARRDMDRNKAYATVVIPAGFTQSVLALYGVGNQQQVTQPIPAVQLLTNARAGSIGVSLATGVLTPAVSAISQGVGESVSAKMPANKEISANLTAQRARPIILQSVPYRPLPSHTALGLSAFYIGLLTIMCGFLGAVLTNSTVDAALGYATTEIGPKWSQSIPVPISRVQTLLAKWAISVVLSPVLAGVLLIVSVAILGLDAPHVFELWLFTSFAAIVVAIGTLTLFAIFGALGQLLAMLTFIYLALASSGGTIPLSALPGFFRFVAEFEPLRQILDGTRAILYFDANGAAGLDHGTVLTAIGLVFWIVVGLGVTRFYDRKGHARMQPELLEYVTRSARDYADRDCDTASVDDAEATPAKPSKSEEPVAPVDDSSAT
jgi:YhgE/Pip-like protein